MKFVLYILLFLAAGQSLSGDRLADEIASKLNQRSISVSENYSVISVKSTGFIMLLGEKRFFTSVADIYRDSANFFILYRSEDFSDSVYEVFRMSGGGRFGSFYMDSLGTYSYVFEPSNSVTPFAYAFIIPKDSDCRAIRNGYEIENKSESDIVRSLLLNSDLTVREATLRYIYGDVKYRCRSYRHSAHGLYMPDSIEMSVNDTIFFSSSITEMEAN